MNLKRINCREVPEDYVEIKIYDDGVLTIETITRYSDDVSIVLFKEDVIEMVKCLNNHIKDNCDD